MANEASLHHPVAATGHATTFFEPQFGAYTMEGQAPRSRLLSQAEAEANQAQKDNKMYWACGLAIVGGLAIGWFLRG